MLRSARNASIGLFFGVVAVAPADVQRQRTVEQSLRNDAPYQSALGTLESAKRDFAPIREDVFKRNPGGVAAFKAAAEVYRKESQLKRAPVLGHRHYPGVSREHCRCRRPAHCCPAERQACPAQPAKPAGRGVSAARQCQTTGGKVSRHDPTGRQGDTRSGYLRLPTGRIQLPEPAYRTADPFFRAISPT